MYYTPRTITLCAIKGGMRRRGMRGNEQQQLFSTVQSYLRTMCMKCHELWYDNDLYNGPTDRRRPVMLLCKVEWTHSSKLSQNIMTQFLFSVYP